jgi:hypothetical protein
MKSYYINNDGNQLGPFTIEEIKKNKIDRETMVWFTGLDTWIKAENAEDLKDIFEFIPPPFKKTPIFEAPPPLVSQPPLSAPPLVQKQKSFSKTNLNDSKSKETHFFLSTNVINGVLISALVFVIFCIFNLLNESKSGVEQHQLNSTNANSSTIPTVVKDYEQPKPVINRVNKESLEGDFILSANGNKVNIRSNPDVVSPVLHQLRNGEEVVYLGNKTDTKSVVTVKGVDRYNYWFNVQAVENSDVVGWVHGDFLNFPSEFYNTSGNNSATYQERKSSVLEIEQADPKRFLNATGTYNRTILGKKIKVHGTITNKATIANFKDIVIQITYFSDSKSILGQENFRIDNFVNAKSMQEFYLKINPPKGTNTVDWDAISAVPY